MNWYLAVLKNYVGFSGRARRTEFWMFVLFNVVISIVLNIIGLVIKTQILSYIYSLAVLLPSLAVGSRRLHDTGKSGWLQLLLIIPFIGAIIMIVFWAMPGVQGPNAYGPDPKMEPAAV